MSKIAYFDCFSGISGDMIVGALIDAGLSIDSLASELSKLGLDDYRLEVGKTTKKNIAATKFDVICKEQVSHRRLRDLNHIIDDSRIEEGIKARTKNIFLKIAEAEAKIHNRPVEEIRFHEIGAVDTIIDVVGALTGLELLGVKEVYCSKLNVGSGFVEFSHGRFPVPAPAAAEILKGIPIYATNSNAELVTPTGAAIITGLTDKFGVMPEMKIESAGYGAGARDLDCPNVLRVFIGSPAGSSSFGEDAVYVIETNIDDMSPQIYDYVMERLFKNGALDVYLTDIAMKKNRPATKLTVLATPELKDKLTEIIFEETTSIGIRVREEKRTVLEREMKEINTEYGKIKIKVSMLNGRILNTAPEYEDCRRIASEKNVSLKQIYNSVNACLDFVFRRKGG